MADWACGAARDLDFAVDEVWDDPRPQIFSWAEDEDGNVGTKARRAFLAYDRDAPELRGSYKLPIALVVGDTLKASPAGLRAAANRLPQADIPSDVEATARAVLDDYFERLKQDEAYQAKLGHTISKKPPLSDDQVRAMLYANGLDDATFGLTRTPLGPIVTVVPSVLVQDKIRRAAHPDYLTSVLGYESPDAATLWKIAELAVNAAANLEKDPKTRTGTALVLLARLWPLVEEAILKRVTNSAELRSHIAAEAMHQAAEMAYGARQQAREDGLKRARDVVKALAKGLAEPDPSARAYLLSVHHEAISRALEGRF